MTNLKFIVVSIIFVVFIYYLYKYTKENGGGGSGFGSDVYAGVATYGRFQAIVGAIFGVIIAVVLISVGMGRLHDPHTATAQMAITDVICNKQSGVNNTIGYNCIITVTFIFNGQNITVPNVNVTSLTPLNIGMTINLRYDPSNPTSVVQEISPRALGWGLIGGGAFLGILTIVIAVLTFKSKPFAAVEGSLGIANSLFSN